MKTRLLVLFVTCVAATISAVAAEQSAPAKPTLAVVIAENLQHRGGGNNDFDLMDLAVHYVARKRQWPVEVSVERFAANNPDHETELSIFMQPLREDVPGEITFRAWTTLTIKGAKHDFGIVSFRYNPRAGENFDDSLERIFRGAIEKMADKIEPLLWPKP